MLPTVKNTAIAGLTALAIAATAAAPAQALGNNEKKFLQGVVAAIVVDRILDDLRRPRYTTPQYVQPQQFVQPQYVQPHYVQPRQASGGHYAASIYRTPAAVAFNGYSRGERLAIQRQLAAKGYYRSGIDGAFGPGTYNAVTAYARDTGASGQLATREGAFGVYDGLIY